MIFNNHGLIIPDISFYQDNDTTPNGVDFVRMKQAGAVGVIIRAGQNSWKDPDFIANWRSAREAGLPRGAYWFFDSRSEPGKQATLWHSLIDGDLPELGLWADFEEDYKGVWKGERNWKTFLEAVKIVFPAVRLGIYTAFWWWQRQIVTDPDYFSDYPLWVAEYTNNPSFIILPHPWRNKQAVFWQYADKGDGPKYGTESLNVDLNFFNGDAQSFKDTFKLTGEVTPPLPDDGDTMATIYGTVITAATLQIRSGPGTNYSDVGDLHYGDKVEASESVGGWWKLSRVIRTSGAVETITNGWAYSNGGLYIRLNEPPPVVDPTPTITLTHTIEVYSDGSIRVDAKPVW